MSNVAPVTTPKPAPPTTEELRQRLDSQITKPQQDEFRAALERRR